MKCYFINLRDKLICFNNCYETRINKNNNKSLFYKIQEYSSHIFTFNAYIEIKLMLFRQEHYCIKKKAMSSYQEFIISFVGSLLEHLNIK